ncbi:MAG TPA: YSC84-related protein [Vicinamibacterales bacterium]|nr:YSC84-related protein [Vicinamibacterales bacterium]
MKALKFLAVVGVLATAGLVRVGAQDKDAKEAQEVAAAIKNFKADADLAKWFDAAAGYAVFPSITKAAVLVGGAGGSGRLFDKGAYIGDVHVTQASIGAALGGQSFAEVIFFETKAVLDKFKTAGWEMAAGMSAVAAASGKSKDAKYTEGVAVFTQANKGLMADVSVGGQKFKFTPKK